MPLIVGFTTFLVLSFAGSAIIGPLSCNDGWQSPSIGKQGACSHHGGVNELPKYLVLIVAGFGGVIAGSYYSGVESRSTGKQSDDRSMHQNFEVGTSHIDDLETLLADVEEKMSCPLCGADMVERTAQKGSIKVISFLGVVVI